MTCATKAFLGYVRQLCEQGNIRESPTITVTFETPEGAARFRRAVLQDMDREMLHFARGQPFSHEGITLKIAFGREMDIT